MHRRFEIVSERDGLLVVDDYAHHPTEIKAVLKSAKERYKNNIYAVFQPHRYSRTSSLIDDFSRAFYFADNVIVTDIYAAGEENVYNIDSKMLVEEIKKYGQTNCIYIKDKEGIVEHLLNNIKSGDMIITLGAGDIWQVAERFAEKRFTEKKFAEKKQ